MSDYRRLISYMYEYEGKLKGKNVGFVKLEARNGQCRLHVNVKRMYVGGNAIGVYLLRKNGEKTFLGNVFVRNGAGEFRTTVDADNVDGRGANLDTYYGLTVHDVKNSWRSYRTMWEDVPSQADAECTENISAEILEAAEVMVSESLAESVSKRSEEKPETDCTTGPVAEDILLCSANLPEEADMTTDLVQELEEEIARSAELQSDSVVPERESREEDSSEPTVQESVSPELENPEVLQCLRDTENAVPDPEALWQELRKVYPKIQPFDYDGTSEVLTIHPQDIGQLPRENWVYGNNSFLLHGYYNFRYLILIRLQNDSGVPRYLIGVPGHYYSSEKYMANMFGFPNFVLSKKQPPNDGRFGYWYTDIKMS